MTSELVCVDPAIVGQVWPLVSGLIKQAMKRGDIGSFQPVEDSIHAGRALLWLASDGKQVHAAAVTELHRTEWRKVCVIVACGGKDRSRWIGLLDKIEDFARAEGCTATRIVGRKGWSRVLADYRTKRIILEKELGNGR